MEFPPQSLGSRTVLQKIALKEMGVNVKKQGREINRERGSGRFASEGYGRTKDLTFLP
jgi:hypothetical protein